MELSLFTVRNIDDESQTSIWLWILVAWAICKCHPQALTPPILRYRQRGPNASERMKEFPAGVAKKNKILPHDNRMFEAQFFTA